MADQPTDLRESVRQRYAAAAVVVLEGGTACCGPNPVEIDESFGAIRYGIDERDVLPAEAVVASLGCGNPAPPASTPGPTPFTCRAETPTPCRWALVWRTANDTPLTRALADAAVDASNATDEP